MKVINAAPIMRDTRSLEERIRDAKAAIREERLRRAYIARKKWELSNK